MTKKYKQKIEAWIRSWKTRGYQDGLPDEAPETLESLCRVPSWRMVCLAIIKNDHALATLGYGRPRCQLYDDLKRVEIARRVGRKSAIVQGRLL